jgi:hypothetical protein
MRSNIVLKLSRLFLCMPPPGARKQSNGNEEEQKPKSNFAGFEYQNEKNDSGQHGSCRRQVMAAEIPKKFFD